MPQMKPSKWTLILTLTSTSIFIIMSSLYFGVNLNNSPLIKSYNKEVTKYTSWIWKW